MDHAYTRVGPKPAVASEYPHSFHLKQAPLSTEQTMAKFNGVTVFSSPLGMYRDK